MKKKNIGLAIVLLAMLGLVVQADVTTTVISTADTGIGGAGTYGADTSMYLCGGTTYLYNMGYVRFDLSGINIDTIVSASLKMTVAGTAPHNDTVTTGRYAPHGLNNVADNTPQNWNEATLNQSNTGLEVNWTNGTLDMVKVIDLDSDAISGVPGTTGITETLTLIPGSTRNPLDGDWARGTTLTTTGAPLVAFLNSRVDDGGLVTFIINPEVTNNKGYGLVTKEELTDLTYRPQLTLTYVPGGAFNPSPADGSIKDIAFTPHKLVWDMPAQVTKWDVWFGASADANELDYQTKLTKIADKIAVKTCFIPTNPLANNTVYSWVVNGYKGNPLPAEPNVPGVIWRFTATSIPIISPQPVAQLKFPTETAIFTIGATSSVALTSFTWYKSDDNANNTTGDDVEVPGDVEVLGTTASSTLTLTSVAVTNEGWYYCVANNTGGSRRSNTARLSIKRLYAHWELNENANDSSSNALHGTLFGAPVFDAGVNETTGHAMVFDGTDDYIDMPDDFSDFAAGITISVWAKPTAAGSYARFIDFGTGAPGDNIFFGRFGATNDLTLGVHIGTGASATVTATNVMVLNEWQMFVATVDESRNVVLYKNGLPIVTPPAVVTGTIPQMPTIITRTSNLVGKSNWTTDAMYAGLMDDIYLYNYARTADDVATAYSDVVGNFCRTKPTYDWDDNCKVDIGDIRIFAATWLECGLHPTTACP